MIQEDATRDSSRVAEVPAVGALVEATLDKLKKKKVLVADDDSALRKVLWKILTRAGYEVITAADGAAALERATGERPDLVITDALMPKMHGFQVCQEIKRLGQAPKVIMLTAVYTNVSFKREACSRYGADDFLTKPFEVTELLGCIENQLR